MGIYYINGALLIPNLASLDCSYSCNDLSLQLHQGAGTFLPKEMLMRVEAQLFSAPDMANFDAKVFTHHRQVRRSKYLPTTMARMLESIQNWSRKLHIQPKNSFFEH